MIYCNIFSKILRNLFKSSAKLIRLKFFHSQNFAKFPIKHKIYPATSLNLFKIRFRSSENFTKILFEILRKFLEFMRIYLKFFQHTFENLVFNENISISSIFSPILIVVFCTFSQKFCKIRPKFFTPEFCNISCEP